jgi:hypothetical protein
MSPETQVLLSSMLTFGLPLIFAAHELYALRRDGGNGWKPDRPPEPKPGPVPLGGAPVQRPLPACLIPVLPPRPIVERTARTRELERV